MKKTIYSLIIAFAIVSFISCSKSSETVNPSKSQDDTTQTGGGGNQETGENLNPDFTFNFNGSKIELSKIQADYGAKTYMTGFDKSEKFVIDITFPVSKDVTGTSKKFSLTSNQYDGLGLFIDDEDKSWYFEGGNINITRNVNNKMSGTFNCKAILLDYSGTIPQRLDSVDITSGVFNNIKVKG